MTDDNNNDKPDVKPEEVEGTTEEDVNRSLSGDEGNDSDESIVDRGMRAIFGDRKPTERFGRGIASESASEAREEVRSQGAPEEINFDQIDQHLDEAITAANQYDEARMEGEDILQNVRNEVNSLNAETAPQTAKKYEKLKKDAEAVEVHEYEFEPNSGEHVFGDGEAQGLMDFIDSLDSEVLGYEGKAQQRKQELKELEEEEQKLNNMKDNLEKKRVEKNNRATQQREDEQTRSLTDDEDVSDFERRATEGRISEELEQVEEELSDVYEQAENATEKKQEYEDEAIERQDAVEEAYRERVSEVRDFFPSALENLEEVVDRFDRISGRTFESLEEINAEDPDKSGQLSEDGRNEVVNAYSEAVASFARKAADQYAQLENAVSELEALEGVMTHEYFDELDVAGELRDELDAVYESKEFESDDFEEAEDFEEYVGQRLKESEMDYSGRDDVREIFNGLEADHTEKLA